MAAVIQTHAAVDDDELNLIKGQEVKVTHRDNSGWWKGEVEGKIGMFPGHCVRLIKEDEKIKQVNTTCIKEGRCGGKEGNVHCMRLIKEDEKIQQVNTTCIKEGRGELRRGMFTV